MFKLNAFLLIWAGQVVSMLGSTLSGFALGIWLYQTTGSASNFALTALCSVLPRMLVSPLAGGLVDCYVLRLATHFTARRNFLPKHRRGRKPKYGVLIRPLPRQHKGTTLPATQPDETYTWIENGVEIRAKIWRALAVGHTCSTQT